MSGKQQKNPETVEEIFRDFKGRREGIIKALTIDFEELYQKCDPNDPSLCLYGFHDQLWQTLLAALPRVSELPEPKAGINLLRDNMREYDWLLMVALHSDAWLYALASYFSGKFGFDCVNRKLLFSMISDLPTIHQVVMGGKLTKVKGAKRLKLDQEMAVVEDPFSVELWTEILSRMPVESLMKFKCVCKTWCSIIDDPGFVSKHLSASKDNSEDCHFLLVERSFEYAKKEEFSLRCTDTFRKVMYLDFIMEHGETCDVDVVDCINGVVLIHRKYRDPESGVDSMAILWNPSIRRSLKIPSFPFPTIRFQRGDRFKTSKIGFGFSDIRCSHEKYLELGFGFDISQCDPKVVAIFYPLVQKVSSYFTTREMHLSCFRTESPGSVAVYSLKMGTWRSIDTHPPCWWYGGPQAFVNQAIHWIGVGNRENVGSLVDCPDFFIVSFDLCNEVFHYIDLPSEGGKERREIRPVVVLDESLALFDSYYDNTCIVWVMEEYGVPGSWTKSYKFQIEFERFLYLKGTELLFVRCHELGNSYDIERKVIIKDLAKTFRKYFIFKVFTYKESLLLSDAKNGGSRHANKWCE